jgi:drug/metabolite transporter (DMT)-like permease
MAEIAGTVRARRDETCLAAARGGPEAAALAGDRMSSSLQRPLELSDELRNVEAVLFKLAGGLFFAVMFASGKFAGELASALQILFLRYVGGFLTLIVIVGVTRRCDVARLRSKHWQLQMTRAFCSAFGGVAIIHANAHMPITDANAISLLSAVFLVGLGMLIFHERPTFWHVVGMIVCVAGAATIAGARGVFASFDASYLWPALIALAAAVLFAFEGIFIKLLSRIDDPLTTLLYVNFFGILLLLVPALVSWRSWGPENGFFIALGPLAITAQYCNLRAFMLAKVSVLAPVGYSALVFATAIGWLFFGEVPTPGVLAGAGLVVAGGLVLALSRR